MCILGTHHPRASQIKDWPADGFSKFLFLLSHYLIAESFYTIKEPLKSDTIPLVPAINGPDRMRVRAVVHRGDVLAQTVLADEQVIEVRADIVHLAIAVLPDRHALLKLDIAPEGPGVVAAVVVPFAFREEALVQGIAVVVHQAMLVLHKVVVQDLEKESIAGYF